MPQLDGLRTLAVTAVVLQHYKVFVGGAIYGVHLFFVLSGFLITGILLAERKKIDEARISRARAFRQFYARRALRIFPLYYFVVLLGVLLNVAYARDYAGWLLTYTINLKMAAQGWYIGNYAHFWSLAIEEQYYLAWPWLILLLPRKWLIRAGIITIIIAPLFRLCVAYLFTEEMNATAWLPGYIATPTTLDSLGMGSLLAILGTSEMGVAWLGKWMKRAIPVAGFILAVAFRYVPGSAHFILSDTAAAIFFAWMVYAASSGFSGIAGKILSAAPIVYLGRISYGIYVYHPLVAAVVRDRVRGFDLWSPRNIAVSSLILATLTVGVATISWYMLERPLNQLKNKFPYEPSEKPIGVPAPAPVIS